MDRNDILKQLNVIFRDVLDDDLINLTDDTKASDIDDWDSLNHVQLVVAIERNFKIRFTASEIQKWENVGEMVDNVQKRLG